MIKRDNLSGFTIIEVSLVLAIAGLIFLMVFVALPGLRATQRDTQRREDVIGLIEKVKKYQSNNRGTLPGSADTGNENVVVEWNDTLKNSTGNETKWNGFYRDYLGETFNDPEGYNYKLQVVKCNAAADVNCTGYNGNLTNIEDAAFPNDFKMVIVLQAKCYGSKAVGSNARNLAVIYNLEGAGTYCYGTSS